MKREHTIFGIPKLGLIIPLLGLVLLAGCSTAYKDMYMSYAAACAQSNRPLASFTDSGGRPITLYNQGGCGIRPPSNPNGNALAWVSTIAKYGVMGLLGFKLFDEGVALGIGPGIAALSGPSIGGDGFVGEGTDILNNTAPPAFPPEYIVNPPLAPVVP